MDMLRLRFNCLGNRLHHLPFCTRNPIRAPFREGRTMIKKILLALGITSMTLTAAACNTVRGAGDDLESAANTVDDEI